MDSTLFDESVIVDFDDNDFDDNAEYSKENINSLYINCLETRFGHSRFRPKQWEIISSIIERKQDNLAVMTTGYGKSLCFQFPSVYLDTVSIIISPLISLMEDQVLSLTISNIKACMLGSAQTNKSIYGEVMRGEYRLVYVTPELITSNLGEEIIKALQTKLTLIAIDEAHCISKWGHDFRHAFRGLGVLRKMAPSVPILAMTATATDRVRTDIIASLNLRTPQVLFTGFDRPNLEFNVGLKGSQGIWADIGGLLQSVRAGSTIIYCLTRKQTEDIAAILKKNSISCEAYHAGLGQKIRKAVHEQFVRDTVRVIVATIAFGMGIDKPDVRQVIHYGASRDLESYYQEVGRAGRDGFPSKCSMFYSRGDFEFYVRLRKNNTAEVDRNLDALATKIREYINTTDCRRQFILQYFEGATKKTEPKKNCCDNCRRNMRIETNSLSSKYEDLDNNGFYDFTQDAELLMKAIDAFNCRTGIVIPILFLRGSKDKKINSKFFSHEIYGKGKSKSEDWWKAVGLVLEEQKMLRREHLQSNVNSFNRMNKIVITTQGNSWLQSPTTKPLKLKLPKDMYSFMKVKMPDFPTDGAKNQSVAGTSSTNNTKSTNLNQYDEKKELMKALLKTRSLLSSQCEIMPYMICSNRALYQMAQFKPMNQNEMRAAKIDGFSDIKIAKFGPKFIQCILELKKFLPPVTNENRKTLQSFLRDHPLPGLKLTQTHLATLDMWKAGKNVEEIAGLRALKEATVMSHMVELIKAGCCSTKDTLRKLGVDDKTFANIELRVPLEQAFSMTLTDIKQKCPPHFTFDELKISLSYIQLQAHLKANNADLAELQKAELEAKQVELQFIAEESLSTNQDQITEIPTSSQNNNQLFESDDDIDFTQIDETALYNSISVSDVQDRVASQSSNCSQSTAAVSEPTIGPPQSNVTPPPRKCSGSEELGKLIMAIEEDEIRNSQDLKITSPRQEKSKTFKRRMDTREKIVYIESSSDEEDSSAVKRIAPDWFESG